MLDKFDIHFLDAKDKKGRLPFFNDQRVRDLISIIDNESIDYIARVIFIFKSRNHFDQDFENYEQTEYLSEYNSKIFDYRKYLSSIYKERNPKKLSNYRSAILERLVFDFKKPGYSTNEAWIEPFVYLITNKSKSNRSIDVAAWDQTKKNGECIECAISAVYVTEDTKKAEVRELQNILNDISDKISIYFVSFTMTNALENTVGRFSNINLVGRDKLPAFLSN